MEIETGAAQFPEKKYINGIFLAVRILPPIEKLQLRFCMQKQWKSLSITFGNLLFLHVLQLFCCYIYFVASFNQFTAYALQRKSPLYIPFLGIARPQPQFQHSCVCERFI